jgi:hypothetical protein
MPAFYLGKPPRGAIPKIEQVYTTIFVGLLKQISPQSIVIFFAIEHTHRISAYLATRSGQKDWKRIICCREKSPVDERQTDSRQSGD